jgi:sarcosine oxidase subunit gamma
MLKRESVLKDQGIQVYNGIEFEELSHIPKINLRGQSDNKDFMSSSGTILDILLPTEPNISNVTVNAKVIWLGPNEWLVEINNENKFKEIFSKLQSTLNPQNTAVTDLTENRTIIKVSGHNLYTLLAKFMVIDLDTVLQKETAVAQTLFIKVPILIVRNHKYSEKPSIDIHTNRSHAQYIYKILVDGSHNLDF